MTKYVIIYKHPDCEWEDIDEFDTMTEARKMFEEYRLAYNVGRLKIAVREVE